MLVTMWSLCKEVTSAVVTMISFGKKITEKSENNTEMSNTELSVNFSEISKFRGISVGLVK